MVAHPLRHSLSCSYCVATMSLSAHPTRTGIAAASIAVTSTAAESMGWGQARVDFLATQTDVLADRTIKILVEARGPECFGQLFSADTNDELSLEHQFPEIADFFEGTCDLPNDVDLKRIHHGEEVFLDHMPSAALILLAKSLPEGYAAPRLSKILSISGLLKSHPYKRLLATLQMVINVSSAHGFSKRGHAVVSAQKLRLWHSAVRHAVPRYLPEFSEHHGIPVNQGDMLATIMGFSLVLIQGWRTLHVHPSLEDQEDFFYLWRVYALMMGLHPEGEPHSFAHIPSNLAEAEEFYAAYCKAYYVEAHKNPEGVQLAKSNLDLLRDMVPAPLASLGMKALPRAYMQLLIGERGCERVAVPYRWHEQTLNWILTRAHTVGLLFEGMGHVLHAHVTLAMFKEMIRKQYGHGTQIMIPAQITDTWHARAKHKTKRHRPAHKHHNGQHKK